MPTFSSFVDPINSQIPKASLSIYLFPLSLCPKAETVIELPSSFPSLTHERERESQFTRDSQKLCFFHTRRGRGRGRVLMGNYKFKLSDMMPNAWFYKLKDMGRARNHSTTTPSKKKKHQTSASTQPSKPKQPHQCHPRKSYYFTRELIIPSPNQNFPDPPRKSSKQRLKKRTVTSSVSAGCSCRATFDSVCTKSDSPPEYSSSSPLDSSPETQFHEPEFRSDRILATESFDAMVCGCKLNPDADDIVIDVENKSFASKVEKLDGFDSLSELELPPIITKPAMEKKETKEPTKYRRSSLSVKIVKEDRIAGKEQKTSPVRRFSVSSPGVRLRINSPRVAGRKLVQPHNRRSVSSSSRRSISDSFAVVKSSFDPQRDFRESMVEMIVENNIRASKDLEDLLACYLSLNSDEYHDLIIKVFKQIWFNLTDIKVK